MDALVPVDAAGTRPDWNRATAVLLVIDLTNARPGDSGRVQISAAALRRALP
jgi:hypothetical protein